MFQAPSQSYLDAFSRGRLDEASLLAKTEYDERWGFPFAFYRPLLETARASGLPLLALNARRELTRAVAKHGLALSPELERELPALDLYDPNHRALFDELMAGHPKGHGSPDNLYAAQVVWDETMAARASDFLLGFRPVRKLLVIAGLAHCAGSVGSCAHRATHRAQGRKRPRERRGPRRHALLRLRDRPGSRVTPALQVPTSGSSRRSRCERNVRMPRSTPTMSPRTSACQTFSPESGSLETMK